MASHTLTVDVPQEIYNELQRRAAQMQRRVEDEVVLALASAIPGDRALPDDLATMLASFAALDDDTLWQLARSRVTDEDYERLAELGDQRQRSGLSTDELREAEELAERHDRILAVRAEAAALLKSRGNDVSQLLIGA